MPETNEHDPAESQPAEDYEAPTVEVLGTVVELTQTIQGSLDI